MSNSIDVNHTNMMSQDQKEIVRSVYNRFLSFEDEVWSDLDELMTYYEFLSDEEIVIESALRMQLHMYKGIKCSDNHDIKDCFAPVILEAVEAIIELYDDANSLHEKNRYVLTYYMVLCELRLILTTNES